MGDGGREMCRNIEKMERGWPKRREGKGRKEGS